ncbi:MAG TPA: DoxX family membrane protein [bacterium]|nr:DoxX family membrane protein [bacterium]
MKRLFDPKTDAANGAVLIRFVAGWTFFWEGVIKFLFASQGIIRFTKLGMPMPEVLAPAIAVLEITGGLALLAGFMTRPFALLFIGEMIVAILSTKIPMYLGTNPLPAPPVPPIQGFYAVLHEGRDDIAQLLCSVLLLWYGPGPWSVDALRAARKAPSKGGMAKGTALAAMALMLLPALALHADPPSAPAALPYAVARQIDLTRILPPPPGAAETRRELQALLRIQKGRTAMDEKACIADQVITVYVFKDVLGEKFAAGNLPKTNQLFLRILATVHVPMSKAQAYWGRKRPSWVDARIKPVGMVPATTAYPSGHSTSGNLMGTILADLLPERSAELHARGILFGQRRLLAGVHYPSDVDAGRLSAAAIAQSLFQDPGFRADFAAAKTEMDGVFGGKSGETMDQDKDETSEGHQDRDGY